MAEPTPPNTAEAPLKGWKAFAIQNYVRHERIYFTAIVLLTIADFIFWDGWATFWAMLVLTVLYVIHFMLWKSMTATDEWADEHVYTHVYRPWDTGHIEDIKENPWGQSPHRTDADDAKRGPEKTDESS
ncbi:MAG: hypothetical protein HOL85_07650 [Rhodospirillaceae bacterium]|jgi:hypothetical protein|nr:hypothetical protein [Rhodospirillaceae bacterium]MBT6137414.1 hypothetical protein [Rhodospirillaceae bacterium]